MSKTKPAACVAITGGATGIGFALAKALGEHGAKIVIGEPRGDVLDHAVETLRASGVRAQATGLDVTLDASVERFASFAWTAHGEGGIDLLINNAGVGAPNASFLDANWADIQKVLDVNLNGVMRCCRAIAPRMIARGSPASIYNVASENAFFTAAPNMASYVASKHAVYGLSDALNLETPDFLHVGVICPGFVGTPMIPEALRGLAMAPDAFAARVVPQIAAREPVVVSHPYNRVRLEARHDALMRAFETYAPREEGDQAHDVPTVIERLSKAR